MLLLASALLTSGLVTRVTQQAYDRFRVDYTGTAIPVLWDADEGTCTASTVVSAGVRDFACTITPTYATQTQADGSASDFQIDNTWPALYAAGTDCCREPVHLGTADFNNYIPTVTVQGTTTVTVTANCIGSVLTYTKVGERIIALDLPSNSPLATYTLFRGTPQARNVTLAGTLAPNSPYSRTAALAASFGLARATEISSCAFLLPTAVVPNGREACRTYNRVVVVNAAGVVTSATTWPTVGNTSSTYGPPSPPPSPPQAATFPASAAPSAPPAVHRALGALAADDRGADRSRAQCGLGRRHHLRRHPRRDARQRLLLLQAARFSEDAWCHPIHAGRRDQALSRPYQRDQCSEPPERAELPAHGSRCANGSCQ